VAALDALVNGEADVALGIAEFPLVGKALLKEEVSAFGCLDKAEFVYLVCRKDRGIANVSDLTGKRVGIVSRTIAEFYLGRFLELHGMSLQDVALVDVRTPEEWVNSIVNGDIDAISIAQPSVNAIVDKLGTNAVVWPVQSNQQMYSLMISSDDWIAEHPELITRFLNSLLQAEEFVQDHPTEAKAIVKKQMNFSDEYMETVWKQNQYSLSLDQSLIVAMEDEARWMIKNNLTNENNVPDFLDYVYVEGLESLKPEAVNIVR
jgi:NitT/TauT family transport system substrate-binding protein